MQKEKKKSVKRLLVEGCLRLGDDAKFANVLAEFLLKTAGEMPWCDAHWDDETDDVLCSVKDNACDVCIRRWMNEND